MPFTKYIGEIAYRRGDYVETVIGVSTDATRVLVLCMTGSEFELYRLEILDNNQNMIANHAYHDSTVAFTAFLHQ